MCTSFHRDQIHCTFAYILYVLHFNSYNDWLQHVNFVYIK